MDNRKGWSENKAPEPEEGCPFDRCPECGSDKIAWTGKEYVCMACGLVLSRELKEGMKARDRQVIRERKVRVKEKKQEDLSRTFILLGVALVVVGIAVRITILSLGIFMISIGLYLMGKRKERRP